LELVLTRQQLDRVRRSWAEAAPTGEALGAAFYSRLFQIAPYTRELFAGEVSGQQKKLVRTLDAVIDNLEQPDRLAAATRDLAILHARRGVGAADYTPVGDALIWALGRQLGDRFDAETRDAWIAAYEMLSREMIRAGREAADRHG